MFLIFQVAGKWNIPKKVSSQLVGSCKIFTEKFHKMNVEINAKNAVK